MLEAELHKVEDLNLRSSTLYLNGVAWIYLEHSLIKVRKYTVDLRIHRSVTLTSREDLKSPLNLNKHILGLLDQRNLIQTQGKHANQTERL